MARIVWREGALSDIDDIIGYIHQFNPEAAIKMGDRLIDLGQSLAYFPHRGRLISRDTREMTNVPPFILKYEVEDDTVFILSIRHGARNAD
jgi:plasmid stabilization system protein ParE